MNDLILGKFPKDKRCLILSYGLENKFNLNKFPRIGMTSFEKNKLAIYDSFNHLIIMNRQTVDLQNEVSFMNTLFHEIGHSTSWFTNRMSRLQENTGFNKEQVYSTEEIIAECLAIVFYCATNQTTKCDHMANSIKYINRYKSRIPIAWGEIDEAILSVVNQDHGDLYLKYSNALMRMIERNNIFQFKKGLYL
jgi:hypothetical protein